MQINHLHHLQYPGVGHQPTAGATAGDAASALTSADTDGSTGAADVAQRSARGRGAAVRQITPAQDAPGVIAKIQSDGSGTGGVTLPPGLVYSTARKAAQDSSDTDADTARMAAQHQQALERQNAQGAARTDLTVGKDGVLVAKPAQGQAAEPQDFVSFAVSTMREYADEQARQKAQSGEDASAASGVLPRSLGEVQKLAARFKLFS